mmetsp:Transcript_41467/g.71006  ORF Transcript_41467/g.71006 Transcript_41467/m.71006 type:complete len:204 (+) Transcript_41467:879-1490(+)
MPWGVTKASGEGAIMRGGAHMISTLRLRRTIDIARIVIDIKIHMEMMATQQMAKDSIRLEMLTIQGTQIIDTQQAATDIKVGMGTMKAPRLIENNSRLAILTIQAVEMIDMHQVVVDIKINMVTMKDPHLIDDNRLKVPTAPTIHMDEQTVDTMIGLAPRMIDIIHDMKMNNITNHGVDEGTHLIICQTYSMDQWCQWVFFSS